MDEDSDWLFLGCETYNLAIIIFWMDISKNNFLLADLQWIFQSEKSNWVKKSSKFADVLSSYQTFLEKGSFSRQFQI